jgi:hypothetical protein
MSSDMPQADANFRIYARSAEDFAVEVVIDEMQPTTVTGFASQEAAEAWIEAYKERKKAIGEYPRGRRPRQARTWS